MLPFHLACGFAELRRVPGYFTEHCDRPIFECGQQVRDQVYLRRDL